MPAPRNENIASELLGFLNQQREPFMAVFHSFWDESGKFKQHPIISFCGVAASPAKLQIFENEWHELLRRHELPWLKMSEALRTTRKLSRVIPAQSAPERIESLKPFAKCIFENLELGIADAIDVEGYRRISPAARKRIGNSDDPFYLAFSSGVMEAVRYVGNDDKVSIVCDDDEETALNCFRFYRRIRIVYHTEKVDARRKLCSIAFADDKEFPALQAADMISALVRLEAHRRFERRFYSFAPLLEYLAEDRGPMSIQWRVSYMDKEVLKNLSTGLEKLG